MNKNVEIVFKDSEWDAAFGQGETSQLDDAAQAKLVKLLGRVIVFGEQITLRVDIRLGIVFFVMSDGRSVRLTT